MHICSWKMGKGRTSKLSAVHIFEAYLYGLNCLFLQTDHFSALIKYGAARF